MKIVLIGYMGSGKSAIGSQLASMLKFDFKDLDLEIETDEKETIPQIFSKRGEIYFRKKERNILKRVLDTESNFVLATGGGTPCYGDAMDLLLQDKSIITIYLKASINVITDRIFQVKSQRPLISHITTKNDLNDFIAKHLFERTHYYTRATYTLNVENKSKTDLVESIILKLF